MSLKPNDPLFHLQHFFKSYPIAECREMLWNLITSAVSYKHTPSTQRENFMYFYKELGELIEAANKINEHGKAANKG